jgi:hypothetical protein
MQLAAALCTREICPCTLLQIQALQITSTLKVPAILLFEKKLKKNEKRE